MPVIARLSKAFYDRFGEEIANELVELLNQVDSASRKDLGEINEMNFARFDAKLEQRVVETTARIDGLGTRLDAKIDGVAAELNAKIDQVAAELNAKIDRVAAELNAKIDQVAAELNAKIDGIAAELRATMTGLADKESVAKLQASVEHGLLVQTRWMVAMWATLVLAIVART